MADPRSVPTPRDVATGRCGAPLTAAPTPTCQAPATSGRPAAVAPYGRHAWEEAVMAGDLDVAARALAFVLAHHADPSGRIVHGARLQADRLRAEAGLSQRQTTMAFEALTQARLIARPSRHTWDRARGRRPITLTLPAAAARTEPPHTGEAS